MVPAGQRDEPHLVLKAKGGKEIQLPHRICRWQMHVLLRAAELARQYSTVEAMLTHPEGQTFAHWVKTKPRGFGDGPGRSNWLR